MKTLIIAEKPSVAEAIADALGVELHDSEKHFENESHIISSAAGHLLEKVDPDEKDKKALWTTKNLRLISSEWFVLQPINDKAERTLKRLTGLYKRKEVSKVINACDPDREGERIFHNIMCHIGGIKPIRRAWLKSLAKEDIRSAFKNEALREDSEMEGLRIAAICRADADQTVGFNASRALTALFSGHNSPVGRVQTPTLAILVKREREREAFKARAYWEVRAKFIGAADEYSGVWNDGKEADTGRIFNLARAEAIIAECVGMKGRVIKTVAEEVTPPPALFNLITLQREANERFGMTAKETLDAIQSIYGETKMATYPRTDSRYLPQGYVTRAEKTMKKLAKDEVLGEFASRIVEENSNFSNTNSRVFNDEKIGSHSAIVPNGESHDKAASLGSREGKIYDMICRRFIAAFSPPAKHRVTEWRAEVGEHTFLVKRDRVTEDAGWCAVETNISESIKPEKSTILSEQEEGVTVTAAEKDEKTTQPPERYTEATLLFAMEMADSLVEDEALRDAMGERGLGTPATRATIIETLLEKERGYLNRVGRELIPTWKANDLILALEHLEQKELAEAEMTAKWERALRDIEKKAKGEEEFMQEIEALCLSIIKRVGDIGKDPMLPGFASLTATCPDCEGKVRERLRRICCDNKECGFVFRKKDLAGRKLSVTEMEALLTNRTTGALNGFVVSGRFFSGEARLEEEKGNWCAVVREEGREIIGTCPRKGCGGSVHADYDKYICERAEGESPACNFTRKRRLLQKDILPSQMKKMLTQGKTDLLDGFISRKTGRPFSAYLTIDLTNETGWGFEFPSREEEKSETKKPEGEGEIVGACPREECNGNVRAESDKFICERAEGENAACDFSFPRRLLQRQMVLAEINQFLTQGKTDLLEGFISKKTGRPFKAHIKIDLADKKGWVFEFSPPPSRKGKGSAAKKTASKKPAK